MKFYQVLALSAGIACIFTFGAVASAKEIQYEPHSVLLEAQRQEAIDQAYYRRYSHASRAASSTAGVSHQDRYLSILQKANDRHTLTGARGIREGDLNDVESYDGRRPQSTVSYFRTNAQQVFRARALDYYVYGGNAGAEILSEGVILGSEHRVNRTKSAGGGGGSVNNADIIRSVRAGQKRFMASGKTGYGVPRIFSYARSGSRFSNPYLKKPEAFQ